MDCVMGHDMARDSHPVNHKDSARFNPVERGMRQIHTRVRRQAQSDGMFQWRNLSEALRVEPF